MVGVLVKGVQVARLGRSCRGGCSRVEHRLFGTACWVASLVPAAPSGVVVEQNQDMDCSNYPVNDLVSFMCNFIPIFFTFVAWIACSLVIEGTYE